ncbi:hypothetical protein TNCV_3656811 [Trichonephila clavipes]|nr:hypothetical protein TNCV_3656811 [Trichonephila clavipes]
MSVTYLRVFENVIFQKDNTIPYALSCPGISQDSAADETNINTPVAVGQHAANCLEKAVQSFTFTRGSSVCYHVLMSSSVIHFQSLEFYGARRSTVSKLASLWNCFAAHKLLLDDMKILLP